MTSTSSEPATAAPAPAAADALGSTPVLDAGTVATWDGRAADATFRFSHSLHRHPLLQLEALAQLADRMDRSMIEVADASSATVVETRNTARLGSDDSADAALPGNTGADLSPGDVIRRADEDGRWLSMRHVETDPAYGALVRSMFDEFCVASGADRAAVYQPEGYVFIGASNATTPAHVDHEHNLFFHVRGTKNFTTGAFPDVELEARTFEGMYSEEYGSTNFSPADPVTHHLEAGDGLYVPPTALHYVENSGSLAISFSLVFHDRALDQTAKVYAANAHLREVGLSPRPPGRSDTVDRIKAGIVDGWRLAGPAREAARRLIRR